jgi:hypothetical protein
MTHDPNQHAWGAQPAEPAPPQASQPASLEGILSAAWTQACGPTAPPTGWLTRTAAAITEHLRTDQTVHAASTTTVSEPMRQLIRLRRQVREQLAGAVTQGDLDGELANSMLEQFDLPLLTRTYQVRIGVLVTVEVSATGDDDAYDLAEDAIEEALRHASGIELSREGGERIEAIAGAFDDDGIAS